MKKFLVNPPVVLVLFFLLLNVPRVFCGNIVADNDTCNRIDAYLSKLALEKNFSGGLLIIKHGEKIFGKGFGYADKERQIPFTTSTLASIGSITKAFTAAAIMKLVEQKIISLNDSLGNFFSGAPSDKAAITIHQLLCHSSGFHEFLENDGGDYEVINKDDFLKRAFKEPLAFKPGEKALYTNVGFSVLGILIEQVSGMDYESFLRKNLFDPAGIKNIGYRFPVSPNDTIAVGYQNGMRWGTHQEQFDKSRGGPYWNLKANGGLEVSLDEMYLWVSAFTNHTILTESSINKMFSPHMREEDGADFFLGYGCSISKSKRNTKVISNGGSNGIYFARIIRYPEEGLVFYMVTNESSMNTNMVIPNIVQLYFNGKIEQDAIASSPKFSSMLAEKIYALLHKPSTTDLAESLAKENIRVDDDMVLLEVGMLLQQENKMELALILYKFYTSAFPNIVVAWNDLGDIYRAQNNTEEADRCYSQALKIRPGNQRAKESLEKLKQ